ncbi:MAG: hypothetical protein ACE5G9_03015 [Nitrospinales bacterium]
MTNDDAPATSARAETLRTAAVFFLALFILVLRNSGHEVLYPILPAEDGRFLFQDFYSDHNFQTVFRHYSGYISVLPNLLAYVLTLLPVEWVPSSFAFVSLCVTAAAHSLFYRVTAEIYGDRVFAVYVMLIVAALPLGNFWLVGALAYQSWNFMVILLLLALLPMPRKISGRVLYVFWVNLLIWSHPLSLLMVPWYLWGWVKNAPRRAEYGVFCLSAALYGRIGTIPGEIVWPGWTNLLDTGLSRVVGEALLGPGNRMLVQAADHEVVFLVLFVLALSAMALLFYFSWRGRSRAEKEALALLTGFACLVFAVSMATRIAPRNLSAEFAAGEWGTQYVYIPKMLFVAILLFSAYPFLKKIVRLRLLHGVLAAAVVWVNLNGNAVYKTRTDNGKKVLQFVGILSGERDTCRAGEKKYIILRKGDIGTEKFPGNFNIRIDICNEPPGLN